MTARGAAFVEDVAWLLETGCGIDEIATRTGKARRSLQPLLRRYGAVHLWEQMCRVERARQTLPRKVA